MPNFKTRTMAMPYACDLTEESYLVARGVLGTMGDSPLCIVCSSNNGVNYWDFLPDDVSIHGLERFVKIGGKPYSLFPINVDAWFLVGKNGNVVFSEGA